MINSTAAYRAAITADSRRIFLKAVVDISDPDMVIGAPESSGEAPWSEATQLTDKANTMGKPYATLEENRWLLNGAFSVMDDEYNTTGQVGFVGDALSDAEGVFSGNVYAAITFSNVDVLQAFSVFFSDRDFDGIPEDYTVEVLQGNTAYYTQTITGNTATSAIFDGFTVYNPDTIKVTVSKWSKGARRPRVVEIIPGIYEEWGNDILASFSVTQQGNISNASLPYGTCTLSLDNLDKRFEPRNKQGIFASIEDRQGIEIYIGVQLPDDTVDYKPLGVFYQYSDGWKTSDNNITMQWNLVDIIGLLCDRTYIAPATLPTTLSGWAASVVSQLGTNFENEYTVDANYAETALTATAEALQGVKCGDVLRYICMASGTWPRADATTGKLAIEPLWNQGNEINLDNLIGYPVMKANPDVAQIIFDIDGTQYVVSGNSSSSAKSINVKNPFIHTETQALTAAKMMLATFGGNQIEAVGRGDPSSEIGDVPTIVLDEGNATTARLMLQTFNITDGVLADCSSTMLQADGSYMFQNRAVITENGTWTAPAGATQLRIIIGDGGYAGTDGTDGSWEEAGTPGVDGAGGKIYAATININEQQSFAVVIGAGGTKNTPPGQTTFGVYNTESGQTYNPAYTDVASGNAYGRTGANPALPNTGNGGKGGNAGVKGNRHNETRTQTIIDPITQKPTQIYYEVTIIDNMPTAGTSGLDGASGFVVVWWDKEAT